MKQFEEPVIETYVREEIVIDTVFTGFPTSQEGK